MYCSGGVILKYIPQWRSIFVSSLQSAPALNLDKTIATLSEHATAFVRSLIFSGHLKEFVSHGPAAVATSCVISVTVGDKKADIDMLVATFDRKTCGCSLDARRLVNILSEYYSTSTSSAARSATDVTEVAVAPMSEDIMVCGASDATSNRKRKRGGDYDMLDERAKLATAQPFQYTQVLGRREVQLVMQRIDDIATTQQESKQAAPKTVWNVDMFQVLLKLRLRTYASLF
ncbi:hypothetical protein H257_00614 [Aphanomyces astaci]|uniref:Uncharacterized protein n=1 Tax=Aphanomyces astaci TaxID=112090 RepID=W4HDQ4_APHAT|nr:hypothetical protein H257_00614 [Aphanomyces astaci]ETV89273.1 hypothetical protein H257_00614 [Aphanomyces astaci]|eukprot:XP_009821673.1 hypothetical protein H257_00614 [Aphanomyces astaci]